jgi:hypothetical protein
MDTTDKFTFYREVDRTAYQLMFDHGQNAPLYAARLAREAESEGKYDEAAFWKAVSVSVTPRLGS